MPIIWRSPLFDPSGIAEDARLFIQGLAKSDYKVSLDPLIWSDVKVDLPLIVKETLDKSVTYNFSEPCIQVNQCMPSEFSWSKLAKRRIARVLFESDRYPEEWKSKLLECDEVWVASQFNIKTFSEHGVPLSKLRSLPNAFDSELFTEAGQKSQFISNGNFNFLSVFDYNPRKGVDVLLRSWAQTFGPNDGATLTLKTYSSAGLSADQINADIDSYLQHLGTTRAKVGPIKLITHLLKTNEIAELFRTADCFVLPTHGEGWGRTLMESLACSTPVITSRFGAHLDFLHDENAFLLDGELIEVPEVALQYNKSFRGHKWFNPNVYQLSELMCSVMSEPALAKKKALIGCQEMHSKYTIAKVAKLLISLLDQ